MITRSGGQYVIVRRGLGEYPGFVVGWTDWISVCGAMSLGAMVITEYLEPLVPALAGRRAAAGVLLVLAFGLLLWRGIRIGDLSQQILSALKAVAFGVLIGLCLLLPAPAREAGAARRCRPEWPWSPRVVLGLQSVIYTYDGWNGPLYFGEEVPNPGRGIPRSMIVGVLLVIAIYLLVNVAFVRVLGIGAWRVIRSSPRRRARRCSAPGAIWSSGSWWLVSILSAINACALMGPRVLLAMSRDGLLHPAFETVSPGARRRWPTGPRSGW